MSTAIPLEQQTLQARLEETREKLAGLEKKQRALDHELQQMSGERQQYQLLEQVCTSLDRLDEMGAASLFWGDHARAAESYLKQARGAVAAFNEKMAAVEQRRQALQKRIQEELATIDDLAYALDEQRQAQEEQENEFIVHRELAPRPYRPVVMPWHGQAEDEQRFRRSLAVALLVVLVLGVIVKLWVFPPSQEQQVVEIPKQLVQLVQRERPKPPPQEQTQLQQKDETRTGSGSETANATPAEKQQARAKAEGAGVLAFKGGFAELMKDSEAVSLKLGADARITANGQQAVGNSQRALIVAQASEGSGGINVAGLSRGVGGGAGGTGTGNRLGGVQFTRVESSIGGGGGGGGGGKGDQPLSDGPGPSRTDEEIQIVFDRYKATLYRIYNRELRTDPTLRGKIVLRITIEPSGEVSVCKIESTDMASAVLKTEVLERVKRFNFGPKENVARVTILYPIEFLPAT